jgi:ABC-2 type transport system permease protein
MRKTQKYILRYRYTFILLKQLVKTDFKLRYQNSFLGYLWSLLKPLFLFAIMYAVFVKVIKVNYGVPHSGIYLLLGIVVWTFFVEFTGGSVLSIVGKGDLLRKLNFPRYTIVLAGAFSALINFMLNLTVVIIFMAVSRVGVGLNVLFLPLLFIELFVFCLALALFLSSVYVKLRDIGYIWDVVLQALFYATPIFFPLHLVPLWGQKIVMLSPLAQTIQDMRFILVSNQTSTIGTVYGTAWIRIVPVAITLALFGISSTYFRKRSKYFAEEI